MKMIINKNQKIWKMKKINKNQKIRKFLKNEQQYVKDALMKDKERKRLNEEKKIQK
jgi:hypothetical protein